MSLNTNTQHDLDERMPIWKSKEILYKFLNKEIDCKSPLVKKALKHSKLYDGPLKKIVYGELFPTLSILEEEYLKNKKTLL